MNQSVQLPESRVSELRDAWRNLQQEQPGLRIRNAAEMLGVSEMELLVSGAPDKVVRLQSRCGDLLRQLEALGPVMTLARNDQVVHETTGMVRDFKVTAQGNMGLCLGEIDLRVFFKHWEHAYAVSEPQAEGAIRQSLQIFSPAGDAIFKIYRVTETDGTAWNNLVAEFRSDEQRPALQLQSRMPFQRKRDSTTDWVGLQHDWSQLEDVHQFHALLNRYGVDRLSALENIDTRWARRAHPDSLERLLQRAATTATPLMLFVGNPGVVQIFTGTVHKLLRTGPWFNVLDPHFNLHANTHQIASTWIVVRPSTDGDITSLECFSDKGELVLTVFGERKPGKPELESWRERIAEVEQP